MTNEGVSSSAGGLVGFNNGSITSSYATGSVTNEGVSSSAGGLVGSNNGSITSSYATGSVTNEGVSSSAGGLVGSNNGSITSSYATGSVTNEGVSSSAGGLVGSNTGSITASYWDTQTSGRSQSDGGVGKTTRELQSPTSNVGIYTTWDPAVWDFRTATQYPRLRQRSDWPDGPADLVVAPPHRKRQNPHCGSIVHADHYGPQHVETTPRQYPC